MIAETGQQATRLEAIRKNKDINTSNFQKLSIQIALNGLSFCTLDTLENRLTSLQHFQFSKCTHPVQLEEEVQTIFKTHAAIFDQEFQSVNVSHVNTLSTFVPKPLFSDKHLADYLKYNNKILPNDYITFDVITNNDMVNVYIPYVNINNFFFEKFGAFQYKHFATILLEHLFQLSRTDEEATVYVHVQEQQFEIVVIQQKKLLFYNSFEYFSSEDFIYYLLYTIEQLQLNPNSLPLYFLGNIDKSDVLYNVAYTYIRHVDLLEKNVLFGFDDEIEKPASHRDFTLLNNF